MHPCCVLTLKVINSRGIHNAKQVRDSQMRLHSNVKGNKFERYSQHDKIRSQISEGCILTLKVINSRGIHNVANSLPGYALLHSNVKGNKFERYSQPTMRPS